MFFVGRNLGCQVHAKTHFPIYKEHCEAVEIKLHCHVLPWKLFEAMKKEELTKGKGQEKQQLTLDNIVIKENKTEFSHEDLLHEIAKFVTCDDQVCPVTFQMWALNLIHGISRCCSCR